MFDDGDFEFDDEVVDAVFSKVSSVDVLPNKTVQKRPFEHEKPLEEQTKVSQSDPVLRPVKKQKENSAMSNNSQDSTSDVFDQFCTVEKTASVKFDGNRSSPIIFHNKPSTSSYLNKNIAKKVVQRKFPGPAGLLPEKMDKNNFTNATEDDTYFKNVQNTQEPMLVSQRCETAFVDKLWRRLLEDLGCEKIDSRTLSEKYNIEWIMNKAANNQLINQKAPFLAASIQSVECSNIKTPVPTVILKDNTGEIQATIDYDLYKEYVAELISGSIIIIKQFSVLSTGTSHVLNITAKNLIRIYYENNNKEIEFYDKLVLQNSVQIINVQNLSIKDIIDNIKTVRDYKKRTEISDEALGMFLDNFNKNFDDNRSNLISKINSASSFSNNQFNKTSFLTKSLSNSPLQSSKTYIPQQNINVNYKTSSKSSNESKFNFNKENKISNLVKEKHIFNSNVVPSLQNCTQFSIKSNNVEEKKIVENIFEGLDTDSFFEDF